MLVLAAAPVADLIKGYEMKVSDEGDAVELYMPLEVGLKWLELRKLSPTSESALEEYRKASPAALLPVTFPLLLLFGDADADVPPELIRHYAAEAAGELVTTVEVPGADHFQVVDASSACWQSHVRPALAELLGRHWGAEAARALL